jgi:hypothetical protein
LTDTYNTTASTPPTTIASVGIDIIVVVADELPIGTTSSRAGGGADAGGDWMRATTGALTWWSATLPIM